MNEAKKILEEVYHMALNPEGDYYAQLEPLSQTGELANKVNMNIVLCKLCMLVDAQAKEIEALKTGKLDPTKPL